jgi:hypothetical protein
MSCLFFIALLTVSDFLRSLARGMNVPSKVTGSGRSITYIWLRAVLYAIAMEFICVVPEGAYAPAFVKGMHARAFEHHSSTCLHFAILPFLMKSSTLLLLLSCSTSFIQVPR